MTDRHDIVIVGGGIVGAATAYHLAGQGADVLLLERGAFGREASGRNAGTLNLINDRTRRFDDLDLKKLSIERWRTLSDELGYDLEVDLTKGTLLVSENDGERPRLEELKRGHERAGIAIRWLENAELRAFAPYLAQDLPAAIYCPTGGMANPRQAAWAFVEAARGRGAVLRDGVAMRSIRPDGGGYRLETTQGDLSCNKIVVAAGPWSVPILQSLGVALPINISYFQASVMVASAPFLLHGLRRVAGKLTLKQNAQGNCILGGGWKGNSAFPEHGTISSDVLAANYAVAVRIVPGLAGLSLLRSWAGYDGSAPDEQPIIDEVPGRPGLYISTGSSGGFTSGPVIGALTAEYVLGMPPSFDIAGFRLSRFDASRQMVERHARS